MSDYVTDQDKVRLLLSVTGLSSAEVACALGCEETDLLSGKLTGQQQARFVELSAAFKSGSAAIESYFGIPGENEAYTELRLVQVLVAAGPECVMLRGSANATQRKALLVSLEGISDPNVSPDQTHREH